MSNLISIDLCSILTIASRITTVYACASSVSTAAGVAAPTGTVGSTGVASAPTPTGSPITYAASAASLNGVSALGMIVAGGVALVCSPEGFRPDLKLTYLPVPVNISSSPLRFDGVTSQHLRSGI